MKRRQFKPEWRMSNGEWRISGRAANSPFSIRHSALAVFLGVILATLLLASAAWAGPDIYELLQKGNELYKAGKYKDALAAYQQAAQLEPQRAEVQVNIGNAMLQSGDAPGAIAAYAKALATPNEPLRARALYNRGTAQIAAQDWDGAIASLRRSLRINPQDEDAKYNLLYAMKKKRAKNEQPPPGGNEKKDEKDDKGGDKDKKSDEQSNQPKDNDNKQKSPEPQERKETTPNEPTPEPMKPPEMSPEPSQDQETQQQQTDKTPGPNGPDHMRKKPDQQSENEVDPEVAAAILDALQKDEQQELKLRMQRGTKNNDVDKDW